MRELLEEKQRRALFLLSFSGAPGSMGVFARHAIAFPGVWRRVSLKTIADIAIFKLASATVCPRPAAQILVMPSLGSVKLLELVLMVFSFR